MHAHGRSIRFALSGVLASGVLLASPSLGRAQSEGKPLAEALFQDGRDLLAAGKTHEACAKLAMSQRIEAKLGTLLNLAVCHEAEGKTATAWAEFTEAAAQADRTNQPERVEFAREHADTLEPRLSRVAITTSETTPITVSIDGVVIDRAALGTRFPVDPGEHALRVAATGKKAWTHTIRVPDGAALTPIAIPALDDDVTSASAAAAASSHAPDAAPRGAPRAQPDSTRRDYRPAWVAFGIGGVAIAATTYFGVLAFSKKHTAQEQCDGRYCSQAGLDLFDQAERSATVSSVALGVGILALGVGTYFLLRPVSASRHASSALGASW